ncbi:fimbrial protein [Pseudomonas fluorescens]|uniref:Fimbrial protein n=1 Tax=Pseudomonas lactucae TaxID=2813360 RepID=A0A9X0Y775_9PSED|nr:fimbrial protein [Pseudomonas lactucae]OPA97978.1 fimbrial protein [Pseudomonas fluorescens]MBN2974622.1 fimbrial protein [Pseudomonas lactucae]MBN2988656.1 fimbrial protein [Pseudomonas lactucae]OPB14590.1 fimbrial protein [Pseudomonas fluorescens]OPB27971.1 fimbrial protein [Pseudomonas fluorescens]
MKHLIKLASALTALCLSMTAQAACDQYQNATLTLTLPSTVIVPDSLAVNSEIIGRSFSGTAPAFFMNCTTGAQRTITGRYQTTQPGTLIYRTEVPGVGVRLRLTDARGVTNFFAMRNQQAPLYGTTPSFIAAELKFYKIGPVTDGVVPAGSIRVDAIDSHNRPERFTLLLGNSVRFVRPSATCDLAAGDVNRTITLPAIQASALANATSAGAHNFELTANCSDASNVTFSFAGTPAVGDAWRFANTGTADGIALWLYSRIGGVNQTLRANGSDSARTVAVSNNRAVLPLGAAYFKNGTVRAGTLASTATVNITYN